MSEDNVIRPPQFNARRSRFVEKMMALGREHSRQPTYTEAQYAGLEKEVARLYPGLELQWVQPAYAGTETDVRLEWWADRLIADGFVRKSQIARSPKRSCWGREDGAFWSTTRRARGRVKLEMHVTELIQPSHPLATFRPSVILGVSEAPLAELAHELQVATQSAQGKISDLKKIIRAMRAAPGMRANRALRRLERRLDAIRDIEMGGWLRSAIAFEAAAPRMRLERGEVQS